MDLRNEKYSFFVALEENNIYIDKSMKKCYNIFALADIHGKWQIIRNFYEKYKETENFTSPNRENIIILLGDAGLNYFFNHRDIETKTKILLCRSLNIIHYLQRYFPEFLIIS